MFKFKPFSGKMSQKKVKILKWNIKLWLVILILLLLIAGGAGYAILSPGSDDDESSNTKTVNSSTPSTTGSKTVTTSTPTPTPSSTPSSSSTGSNNTAPDNTPTPTPVVFAATAASATASRQTVCSNVDTVILFTGTITANAAGAVTYHWARSDGGVMADAQLTFSGAGTQAVAGTSWSMPQNPVVMNNPSIFSKFFSLFEGRAYALPAPELYWEQIVVTSPNSVSSNQAGFSRSICIN
jgi:cytoskeletal protein RodZ